MSHITQLMALLIVFLFGYSLAPAKVKTAEKPMYELLITHEQYYTKLCNDLQKFGLKGTDYIDFCIAKATLIQLRLEMDKTIDRVYNLQTNDEP